MSDVRSRINTEFNNELPRQSSAILDFSYLRAFSINWRFFGGWFR